MSGFTVSDATKITWMAQGLRFDNNGVRMSSTSFIDTSAIIAANAVRGVLRLASEFIIREC